MPQRLFLTGSAACFAALAMWAPFGVVAQEQQEFARSVAPILNSTCSQCHNERVASGGLNVARLNNPESVVQHRDDWDRVLRRVEAGEMPPPNATRPPAPALQAFVNTVRAAFARADARTAPDPGRVTARRLNRNEYSNTIRDLLGVEFRAERYFPTDDSGDGFDNIGEVLTVSPLLMERYMNAAERVARWAISTEMPPQTLSDEYHLRDRKIRRVDPSTVEAIHQVEYAGEYTVRFGLPGERAPDGKPVTLNLWMDGQRIASKQIETKPSGLVYFDPYSDEEMKVTLPAGDHVFRAGFTNDEFIKTLPQADIYNNRRNKFLNSITFIGPLSSTPDRESRKRILSCDPESGAACVERILSTLARRAYRRPVTAAETAGLMRFVEMAKADGHSTERGLQLAIQAMLVSPNFLFRIERDARPTDPTAVHPVSDIELASRLSYFLWSSMPDDELLALAETGRLREPEMLRRQVARMLADPRSVSLAANFAGQWLEIRNLDVVQPDPKKYSEWNPELRDAMKAETTLFFEHILKENRPISDFINARYTFLNERLAKFYNIEGITGPEFRRVELSGDQRGGVLSHASVLTVSSYADRTSPVIRGKYVLTNLLGTPPPAPPPDVPDLNESSAGPNASMREQLEKHRSNAVCASCHSRMDPLGFGLENYDAIGRWRTMDGDFSIDASGTLPDGRSFSNPAEMRAILLSQLPQFSRTMTEKMLTYALGRGLKPYDRRTVDEIQKTLAAQDYNFQSLILQIVESLPFQARRGEEVTDR
jgi:hypothetical protein